MYPRYYALRRVNPYRGVVAVVDVGDATAHSFDGHTWHLRADDGYGLIRPVGVWEEGTGWKMGRPEAAPDLIYALEAHPPLPFPFFDTWELWLLHRETGLPLAILDTAREGELRPGSVPKPLGRPGVFLESREVQWLPFTPTYTGFRSATLLDREKRAPGMPGSDLAHRDMLFRIVNHAARPRPMTQWFRRDQSGMGEGEGGTRLPYEWRHRQLSNPAFPELLVQENWNSRLEQSVIADYHAWLAPLLLLWPRLSPATRGRLEALACERPRWLVRVHRLLPRVMNPARLNAALVAARLEMAQGGNDDNWIEN